MSIKTTHVGSLPRPQEMNTKIIKKQAITKNEIRRFVSETLEKQLALGITYINNGELPRLDYIHSTVNRISGFHNESIAPMPKDMEQLPEYSKRFNSRNGLITLNAKAPVMLPACSGPLSYTGEQSLREEIEMMISVYEELLPKYPETESKLFFTSPSPGTIALFLEDQFYSDYEIYLQHISEVLKKEYDIISSYGVILQVDCPDLAMGRHTKFKNEKDAQFLSILDMNVRALNQALENVDQNKCRAHICWGNYPGTHHFDIALEKIITRVMQVNADYVSIESSNHRHAHEWEIFKEIKLPDHKIIMPGVIDTASNTIEHPNLVAQRLLNFANMLGHERVIGSTDCGFASTAFAASVTGDVAWLKLQTLVEGAKIADATIKQAKSKKSDVTRQESPKADATPIKKWKLSNVRVANFSPVNLLVKHVLPINNGMNDIKQIATEIRRYADLPYVFLLTQDQIGMVLEVLEQLKLKRSTCYPHALFVMDYAGNNYQLNSKELDLDVIRVDHSSSGSTSQLIAAYAVEKFAIDDRHLKFTNQNPIPKSVDVVIVGAGITGLYAANQLLKENISFCVVEKDSIIGGIWSKYANTTSQVNTSEAAYRIVEKQSRSNRDHSTTIEILKDLNEIAANVSQNIYLNTSVDWIEKKGDKYEITATRGDDKISLTSNGVILAINDRVGQPRKIEWNNENLFKGQIVSGISDETNNLDWKDKKVVIVGMGAFAIENTRTALEAGARQVTIVCRRHGTVCPKIIDYLNFATPYNEKFEHDKKSNMRNMILWKKLYDLSGAIQPECWMGKIKHDGHTISVSDLWFIGHFLKKIKTVTGSITSLYTEGIIIDGQQKIEADVLINCVGFYRNASTVKNLCNYKDMYNVNYLDKDFMYLADAHIDDNAFNSFFGSSVLEMVKFYMEVFTTFFKKPEFHTMLQTDGITKHSIEDRSWSHYITGANALIHNHQHFYDIAKRQVNQRTKNFLEVHDLETYVSQNKREWIELHSLLSGKPMKEEDCLPYIFQKLIP